MGKIYQVFNLDVEVLKKGEMSKLQKLDLPGARKKLLQELEALGYHVLEGSSIINGLPSSLIVVEDFPSVRSIKLDFYGITGKLNLQWYRSGDYYLER